jgi:hypothetical protein
MIWQNRYSSYPNQNACSEDFSLRVERHKRKRQPKASG